MTIVELPDKATGESWIDVYTDNRYVFTVYGIAEIDAQPNGKWCITIRDANSINGFIHADAIRRK